MPSSILHPGLQNIPRPVLAPDLQHPIIQPIVPPNIQQNNRGVINSNNFISEGMFAPRNHNDQWQPFNVPLAPQNGQGPRTAGPAVIGKALNLLKF